MKSEFISHETEKNFIPFTVEITAETIEEARLLWHIFNFDSIWGALSGKYEYDDDTNAYSNHVYSGGLDYETWEKINNEIKKQGYEI